MMERPLFLSTGWTDRSITKDERRRTMNVTIEIPQDIAGVMLGMLRETLAAPQERDAGSAEYDSWSAGVAEYDSWGSD